MNEDRAEKEGYSSLELFRAELARVHHLDWVALTTFALLGLPALGLLGLHEMAGPSGWPRSVPGLTAVALAAAGAHALVGNASDYWISFTVASQALRATGLTERGAFPLSLMAYPPHTLGGFVSRLVFGSRGALLLAYLVLGALGGLATLHHYVALPAAFVLAGALPLSLAALSVWVSFSRLQHLLLALVQEVEVAGDSRDEMAERHCSMAETLVLLDPPRLREAISHYKIALDLQPGHPPALEGLERLTARIGRPQRRAKSG